MKWKRSIGLSDKYSCYKCGGSFTKDEFDIEEDICTFCLFPEAAKGKSAEIGYEYGDAKNKTNQRAMLDNLDYIPEKQSKQAKEAYTKYKNRNLYKR